MSDSVRLTQHFEARLRHLDTQQLRIAWIFGHPSDDAFRPTHAGREADFENVPQRLGQGKLSDRTVEGIVLDLWRNNLNQPGCRKPYKNAIRAYLKIQTEINAIIFDRWAG